MSSRRAWVLPVLVIEPCTREAPEEYSVGTRPTNEPMVLPVNRCQSPISMARANDVNVDTPRRQLNRRTTGVNSRPAAITAMAADSECPPVVRRLSCLRGVSTLTSFALAIEIGDWCPVHRQHHRLVRRPGPDRVLLGCFPGAGLDHQDR